MSGGHWNYDHGRFAMAAEERHEEALSFAPDEYTSVADSNMLAASVDCVAILLDACAEIEKATDWCISCDTGPDTLRKELRELHRKHRDAIRIALMRLNRAAWNDTDLVPAAPLPPSRGTTSGAPGDHFPGIGKMVQEPLPASRGTTSGELLQLHDRAERPDAYAVADSEGGEV